MKLTRSISSVLLAMLILVSSTSFVVGVHFCMGEVKNVALFDKADSCSKMKPLPTCHKHKPCCEDETFFHDGDDFKASVEHIHIVATAPMDVEQPAVVIAEVIPSAEISRVLYHNYDPPLRSPDLTLSLQVFLI